MAKTTTQEKCSFCGKAKNEALILVSGIDANICESCIEQADLILAEEVNRKSDTKFKFSLSSQIKPKEIKAFLDDYVIDQDEAKRTIAVAVYNHYKRLNQKELKILRLKNRIFC